MKKVVIILSVLITMDVIYGDMEDMQKFRQDYEACAQKLEVPINELRIDTTICAAIEDGKILYTNGAYNPEASLRKLQAFIPDPIKLKQAYEIYYRCDNEAVQAGAIGVGKTIRFLLCGLSIISLINNP